MWNVYAPEYGTKLRTNVSLITWLVPVYQHLVLQEFWQNVGISLLLVSLVVVIVVVCSNHEKTIYKNLIHIFSYIYIYIYIEREREREWQTADSLSMCPHIYIYMPNIARYNESIYHIYIFTGSTCRLTCKYPDHDVIDTRSDYSDLTNSHYLSIVCTYGGDWLPSITDVTCLPQCQKVIVD